MMSPDNILPKQKPGAKDESESSNGRKTAPLRPPDQQPLKCPRCDSPNTKFCYYNNYSLTQPRHFCKTCRRYWTKGGALRNVPIGGGCRKNKKISKSSSSRLSVDSKDYSSSGTSSEIGGTGLKFFNGLSPAMDFQLGGLSFPRPAGIYNQFSSFGDILAPSATASASNDPSGGSAAGSLMGFNYNPLSSVLKQQGDTSGGGFGTCTIQDHMGSGAGGGGSMNVHTNLASSIESLSFINQDLHWKLQQQRLAMLFGSAGDNNQKEIESQNTPKALQPILFENLEISKPDQEVCVGVGNSRKDGGGCTGGATEWFFDNSYAPAVVTATPANSNSNGGNDNTTSNNWSGIQAWSTDLHQYSALP